jgi:dTDP-4-amino-4,6-dideoxygalactose transaminase
MIPLNKPFLPPQHEYQVYLNQIWQRNWLTNHGPLVKEFEQNVSDFLGTEKMVFVNNGTNALQIAIKVLELKGEIITTPYSYVATTSSIVWEHCTPVFVDIDESTLNIDPGKIESAITDKTSGIIATHVYGNPCDVESIQKIAAEYNLKVIFDAAHCFGVRYKSESVYHCGDISIASFHATKPFHTVEGGGLFTMDTELRKKIRYMMNFGHDGPYAFQGLGINGKNSELHAAMGLCNLKYANEILEKRKMLSELYDDILAGLPLKKPEITENTTYNHAYYPVIFETKQAVEAAAGYLSKQGIETRSYFKPSLNRLPYVNRADVPVSESVSNRVLCLPLYYDLTEEMVEKITGSIRNIMSNFN